VPASQPAAPPPDHNVSQQLALTDAKHEELQLLAQQHHDDIQNLLQQHSADFAADEPGAEVTHFIRNALIISTVPASTALHYVCLQDNEEDCMLFSDSSGDSDPDEFPHDFIDADSADVYSEEAALMWLQRCCIRVAFQLDFRALLLIMHLACLQSTPSEDDCS
jgi:hypothetical protein